MSDSRKFEIQISTPADVSGSQKAAASLGALKVSVDGLSQSTRQQLGLLSDAEKQQQKFNEKVEESNLSTRDEHRIMGDINRVLPGIGGGLHAAFAEEPIAKVALGAAAFLEVLAKIHEYLNDVEARGREAFASITESCTTAQTGIETLSRSNEEFWRALERHRQEADSKNQYDAATKLIEDKLEQARRLTDAQKQSDLAAVDASVKAGQLPAGQAEARKTEIEAFYRDLLTGKQTASTAAEDETRGKRIEELGKQLENLTEELHALDSINGGVGAVARDQNILELKNFMSELSAKFKAGDYTEIPLPDIFQKVFPTIGTSTFANDPNFKNFTDEARKMIANLLKDKTDRETFQKTIQDMVNKTSSELDQLKAQQTQSSNRTAAINEVQGQINSLNNLADAVKQLTALGVLGHTTATPVPFHPGQNTYSNSEAENIFNRGAAALSAQDHLQRGQKLSEDNQRAIAALNQLIESLGWGPQVVANMDRSIRLNQSLAGIVRAMDQRIHQLEEDIKAVSRPRS